MADPKYAGLPGIVYDQPDVYETSDLPESDQDFYDAESGDPSPSVEILHISGTEAHERFKGHVLDPAHIDFSDRISKGKRTGYAARRVEWEIEGDRSKESIVQKYQRLQCETDQLMKEIQQIKGDLEYGEGKVSSAELGKQVEELHSVLLALNLKDALGGDVLKSLESLGEEDHKKVMRHLDAFNKGFTTDKKGSSTKSSADVKKEDAPVIYELLYGPEQSKLSQMERAAVLEKRLDKLEALVGNDTEKLSVLSTWTNHKSLIGAVRVLTSRLALLEPAHLDHIEGRLHAVHTQINQVSDKKQVTGDADKQSRVNDLYDLMKKSEVLCAALPEIMDRVVSIEELYQEAAKFSQSLKQLDVAQGQLTTQLQTNEQLLSSIQKKFSQDLANISSNISKLEERVQKLTTNKK